MLKKSFVVSLSLSFFVCTVVASESISALSMWNSENLGLSNPAAVFHMTSGGPSVSATTEVVAFSSVDCSTGNLGNTASSSIYTFNSIHTVQANGAVVAAMIYDGITHTSSSVRCIQVIPEVTGGAAVFSSAPSFPVTCTRFSCRYTGAAANVTIN